MDTAPPSLTTKPVSAPEPFDGRDCADVTLRSSDQYDFHVHKVVLILASPFFKQMFSLSQPASSSSSDTGTSPEPLPVVPVAEDHDTIDHLLRLCYPVADPTPAKDVRATAKILEAAMKYELAEATDVLKELFLRFIPTEPLQVYAHACRLRLEQEASKAAKRWREIVTSKKSQSRRKTVCQDSTHSFNESRSTITLCRDYDCMFKSFQETALGSTWVDDMEELSAGCFYRLVRFMRTGETAGFCDPPPVTIAPGIPHVGPILSPNVGPMTPKHCPTDITLKSSDGKSIQTYRTFLAFAGASELLDRACNDTSPGDIPVADIDADERTILTLLGFCEPLAINLTNNKNFLPGDVLRMWNVAQKYGMVKAMEAIRSRWAARIEDAPLESYLLARKCSWFTEMQKAMTRSMDFPLFDEAGYAPNMEVVRARFVRDFYQFQYDHRRASTIMRKMKEADENLSLEPLPAITNTDTNKTIITLPIVPFILFFLAFLILAFICHVPY